MRSRRVGDRDGRRRIVFFYNLYVRKMSRRNLSFRLLLRGSEVGTVEASQKAGAPQAIISSCQGTVFELLQPKCQGTVLERTRRTAESNYADCCTAASNSAWRFFLRLGGTVRKHAVAIEARLSLAA